MIRRSIRQGVLLLTIAGVMLAQTTAGDRWIGTWKLNVEKSQSDSGTRPMNRRIKLEPAPGGMKVTQNVGDPDQIEFTAKYDEKHVAVNPASPGNTAALKRIDGYSFEAVIKSAGRTVATYRMSVSRDGKVLTQTQITADARIVSIYDKLP